MTDLNRKFLMFLGQNIRNLRERKNISQEQFGKMVGVHRTYVGMIERGEKNMTIFSLQKFAEALGMKVKDLIDF
jgi:transcriptional regulator with XRE-family HTH domain